MKHWDKPAFTRPLSKRDVRALLSPLVLAGLVAGLLAVAPARADTSTIVGTIDINADLATADQPCLAIEDPLPKTECFNRRERLVWLKDSPASIDSFDIFCAHRSQLINALASGSITQGEYIRGFHAASRRLWVSKTVAVQR